MKFNRYAVLKLSDDKLKKEHGRCCEMKNTLLILFAGILLLGCNGTSPFLTSLQKVPPYQKYLRSLEQADLDRTLMAQQWMRAGESALQDSIIVPLPFSESGYFNASQPGARSYRFNSKKGQVLTVSGAIIGKNNPQFFLDLFTWKENGWVALAHGDSLLNLQYEFEEDHECLIRIQPELLVTAYYTLSISHTPVLINPVAGATNKSIKSYYGDSRDGGRRKHEGIDIFATKGTPIIAPTDGFVSRVGNSKLGGKVVWMQDKRRRHSYYFAHLDEQLVKAGTTVTKGDTLGTVGNTGNARYTPSHLHFGIYQNKSIDPVDFVRTLEAVAKAAPWDTTLRQSDFKVAAKKVVLRAGPSEKQQPSCTLQKETYVQVIAQSTDWYRVMLPNGKQSYVLKDKIIPIASGKKMKIRNPTVLLSETHVNAAPLSHLKSPTTVEVLAKFENFKFVKTKDGLFGWLLF
jgi:SH3-like domain-containing protein